MDPSSNLEIVGRRAYYRPSGSASLDEVVDGVTSAIATSRKKGASELLVDISAVTGFAPPSTPDRFFAIEKWATAAAGKLRLAVVARAETVDAQKFGVTVARNRGLAADIFTTEAEATAWLHGRHGGGESGRRTRG
jgi:hypothetical protein